VQSVTGTPFDRTGAIARLTALLERLPSRFRWAFVDQILVSGVNALTAIILVRSLGLHAFGVYSIVLIGVQFLAVPQAAGILAPMMSLFDQRRDISRSSYLAAVLLHQIAYGVIVVALILVASTVVAQDAGVDFILVAAVAIATQFQDLSRRFFYVTERPTKALLSDAIAYGARFAAILTLAFADSLTIDLVWVVMIMASVAAVALLTPDLAQLDLTWRPIKTVTQSHKKTAGWMLGNELFGLLSDNSFVMLIIGAVLGPAQLGAVRAVQTIVQVLNLLHQSLENFVPSSATKTMVRGGGRAVLRYVTQVSLLGAAGITAVIMVLLVFADPIMQFVYGRAFADQFAIIVAFGAYSVQSHIAFVVTAGLRALEAVRAAFIPQVILGVATVVLALYTVDAWGVVGTLFAVLVLRALFTGQLAIILRRNASTAPAQETRAAP
jgi:O-antigen/teichoic acid export membrane protein